MSESPPNMFAIDMMAWAVLSHVDRPTFRLSGSLWTPGETRRPITAALNRSLLPEEGTTFVAGEISLATITAMTTLSIAEQMVTDKGPSTWVVQRIAALDFYATFAALIGNPLHPLSQIVYADLPLKHQVWLMRQFLLDGTLPPGVEWFDWQVRWRNRAILNTIRANRGDTQGVNYCITLPHGKFHVYRQFTAARQLASGEALSLYRPLGPCDGSCTWDINLFQAQCFPLVLLQLMMANAEGNFPHYYV